MLFFFFFFLFLFFQSGFFFFFFVQLLYLESGFFYLLLTLRQLIQPDLGSRFIARSQLGPSIQSGSSPNAGLQVVTQSTHLSKDCYLQLVSNLYRSEIRSPKQLDYRCMPVICSSKLSDDTLVPASMKQWKPKPCMEHVSSQRLFIQCRYPCTYVYLTMLAST